MSRAPEIYAPGIRDYVLGHGVREPEILARLREETARHPRAQMQIPPEQGQLFELLIKLTGARRALEIGVFTGYSSLATALALPEDGKLSPAISARNSRPLRAATGNSRASITRSNSALARPSRRLTGSPLRAREILSISLLSMPISLLMRPTTSDVSR